MQDYWAVRQKLYIQSAGPSLSQPREQLPAIKLRMVFPTVSHCRYYQTVDQEVRQRQERLTRANPPQMRAQTGGQEAVVLQLHDRPPPTRG
jgi:hypothetical protein